MDRIIKTTIFDGFARVSFIDVTEAVNAEIKIHGLSPLGAAALGRTLSVGAYVAANLKTENNTFSITINGKGELGEIVVAGDGQNRLRAYVGNPSLCLPLRSDGHLDVGTAVGKDGTITVVKDLGLKEPYVGKVELVCGEIAEDFAKYLLVSEGIKSAVAFGVRVDKNGCVCAGGIVAEAMPGITEPMLCILEDVMTNFASVSEVMEKMTIEEIFDFYFAHLNAECLAKEDIHLSCNCSAQRIENLIKGLSKEECEEILRRTGAIEAVCHFCEMKYRYDEEAVKKLWAE